VRVRGEGAYRFLALLRVRVRGEVRGEARGEGAYRFLAFLRVRVRGEG